ncbi:ParD-like family protein [Paraglaciecola arctica]|uniref:ParD-like antitoxin of type II toxin-antitoxin system n=1 Tax=Paraglaciecola arctica BSs20135 TaxID=493475 RepID=K6YUE7_9ALTE|nr:hypothetical protein [Paraglaciecola arctica]GAC20313.1 hypothetical protein GARC_3355 [Paraglaciecola arctica BSs20135]
MSDTVKIKLDNFLIQEAEKALEQYPKTASEQIERWCYIGMAAEKYLTGEELIALQLGNGKVVLVPKA